MRGQRWLWGGMLLWAAGCVAHRGPWLSTTVADDAPDPAGVDLVLLGSMAPPDRGAQAMAARVEQVLDGSRPAVVLWLGDLAAAPLRTASRRALRRGPRCTLGPSDPWPSPAVEALMVATQGGRASASFAVPGVLDHRCGYDDAPEFNPDSRRVPGTHYVLQVYADGSVTERASCREGVCRVSPSDTSGPQPLVELVMVDLGPWLHPADDPAGRARDDERVRSLEAMLEAVALRLPEAAPPRLLVSSAPVEAAGEHGLGTLWPESTYGGLPPVLQRMVVEGHFAGVLAAHDHSLSATPDLSDAIKRADRAWLRAPVFQVQAGAITYPNRRPGMALRPLRFRRSQAHRAPVFSDHPGFAVVHLHEDRADVTLHARRAGRWETATTQDLPLRPKPFPSATPSPTMAPCRDCKSIPVDTR